ncbi:MAG TPA: hypothetical protein VLF19_00925 [Methylomirabilota bacterium]|nr:hypothetical protein [Methylomirabilota bacterium]
MDTRAAFVAVLVVLAVSACAEPEREWLKVNQPYSAEEFRRDIAACTQGSALDEECMKGRGWISVSAKRSEKSQEPIRAPASPRYR